MARWNPWAVLACLTALCALYGAAVVSGANHPPDEDSLRDLGFIQADLDGNWFGDPTSVGEARWYPPLIPAIGAALVMLSGASPPLLWVNAAPWLNLLTPVTFFLLGARLFNPVTAAISTAILVFYNGTLALPYDQAGYTPWPLTPHLVLPFFFVGATVVHALGGSRRLKDAVIVGGTIGIVSLGHPVPALVLAAMAAAMALGTIGTSVYTLTWLGLAGVTAFIMSLPYVGLLFLRYGLVIKNTAPGMWTPSLFALGHIWQLALLNLSGVVALGAILVWGLPVRRATALMLLSWTAVCLMFLGRHELCLTNDFGAICGIFVVPIHHYHFYLSAAWALIAGYGLHYLATHWQTAWRRSTAFVAAVGLLVVIGWPHDFSWPGGELRWNYDAGMRNKAMSDPQRFDDMAYRWITRHIEQRAPFVTNDDASDYTVMAAGRALIAAPELHSNPYIGWEPRAALKKHYLTSGCEEQNDVYFMLPLGDASPLGSMTVFSGAEHNIYRCSRELGKTITLPTDTD